MVDVTTSIEIARPLSEVAGYCADPSNATEWYANIKKVHWRTAPTVEVGARVAFTAEFLRRTLEYEYEIVEFEPLVRLVMRTTEGPFPMQTTYEWTAVSPTVTRVTLNNAGEPLGFSRLVAPMMTAAMRRANTKDLQALKRIVESRYPE
ncbi:SRPBCC family protein [Hoyosella rhizosphaerae]|uniref:ATPase n=1 Tax=Hoyosella rhizosphaerae TaxID=1755582 RepID=A0A916TYL6_9ACTN|nr:SRPBCC family protein [Hoyosella rhizosphaerae]MBN4927246.1 SRPBCC family protein [Hoyosella rhizosphaerae]GGC52803.1 ATPase [Hoyosella rhizosphaerae]